MVLGTKIEVDIELNVNFPTKPFYDPFWPSKTAATVIGRMSHTRAQTLAQLSDAQTNKNQFGHKEKAAKNRV